MLSSSLRSKNIYYNQKAMLLVVLGVSGLGEPGTGADPAGPIGPESVRIRLPAWWLSRPGIVQEVLSL